MADFNQGDVIRDYLTVVDENMQGITGLAFEVMESIDPDGSTFTLQVTEIADGTYRVSWTATKVGVYYYHVQTIGLDLEQSFENTFTVGPFSIYGAAINAGAEGISLGNLVQQIASDIGDFKEVTATENGSVSGSNFVDHLRLAAVQPAALEGAGITIVYPEDSGNYLMERRILDSSEDATQLTVIPNFPAQVTVGQKGWITNLHSRGNWFSDYVNAVNNAIIAAFPHHLIPVDYEYPDVFTTVDPQVPAPQYMTHVYAIHAYDEYGTLVTVDPATNNNLWGTGWSVDRTTASFLFGGTYQHWLNGYRIRVLGYGRPSTLATFEDTTTVDAQWIKEKAAAALLWKSGDQRLFAQAANFQNLADTNMLKILTPLEPGVIRFR